MARRCHRVQVGDAVAIVTVDEPPRRPCAFCGELTGMLCDFPLRGKREGRTCSKRMCERCSTSIGKDLDLCPSHEKYVRELGIRDRMVELLEQGKPGHTVLLDLIDEVRPLMQREFQPKSFGDWREFLLERAAIYEYLGEMSRVDAERRAREDAGPLPKR